MVTRKLLSSRDLGTATEEVSFPWWHRYHNWYHSVACAEYQLTSPHLEAKVRFPDWVCKQRGP